MVRKACNREWGGNSCDRDRTIRIAGETYDPVPYGEETPPWDSEECHDCGTPRGGIHHPGCDAEACPRCGGQIITCGCLRA